MNRTRSYLATLSFTLLLSQSAPAILIFNAVEIGGDVIISTESGGSLDLSTWTLNRSSFNGRSSVNAPDSLIVGEDFPNGFDQYRGDFSQQADFGSGGASYFDSGATIATGPFVGFRDSGGLSTGGFSTFWVPRGYISGSELEASSSTFAGQSFASLGLVPGTYEWTWDTAAGGTDRIRLNIVSNPVPVGGHSALLLAIGLLGLAGGRRLGRKERPGGGVATNANRQLSP